jgi:NAD+ synthase/NAD+ synthase (glutamine-hydrolysing)
MKIALAQRNYTVADLTGNAERIADSVRQAHAQGADLVVTSELALQGYLPRDLLLEPAFINRSWEVLEQLADDLRGRPPVLVGIAEPNRASQGRPLYNSAALIQNGRIGSRFRKCLLPTYDVFDEDRYFESACVPEVLVLGGANLGVTICEDVWNDSNFWRHRRYHVDPVDVLAQAGARCVLNLSASPFSAGKQKFREVMLSGMAAKHGIPVLYVNQVGGNDDLVFDGRSCVFDAAGRLAARGRAFEEDLILVDPEAMPVETVPPDTSLPEEEVWHALLLGTRDYVHKCGFARVLLGLSGGIDSSLTAAIAVGALGASNVLGVLMPSPYTSHESIDDALKLAENLGIRTLTLPIASIMKSYDECLQAAFAGYGPDVTEENIQARIRGNLLMALSNKFGSLLLTTGNKSEIAVGYCTLYGDMSGGLAVISDVPKTMVYRLALWLNRNGQPIPERVFHKAPSAELRPNQTDQDTLPAYDVLDDVLQRHIEQRESVAEIVADGLDADAVRQTVRRVDHSEFKRKQAAPGIKVTDHAFGTGWRMPVARADWESQIKTLKITR